LNRPGRRSVIRPADPSAERAGREPDPEQDDALEDQRDLRARGQNLGYALATTTFPLILLWYRNRAPVKKAFGLVEE